MWVRVGTCSTTGIQRQRFFFLHKKKRTNSTAKKQKPPQRFDSGGAEILLFFFVFCFFVSLSSPLLPPPPHYYYCPFIVSFIHSSLTDVEVFVVSRRAVCYVCTYIPENKRTKQSEST